MARSASRARRERRAWSRSRAGAPTPSSLYSMYPPHPLPQYMLPVPTWTKVVGKKEKRTCRVAAGAPPRQQQQRQTSGQRAPRPETKPRKVKEPKSEAIVLTCSEGQYGPIMGEVRQRIKLDDLGMYHDGCLRSRGQWGDRS